MRTPPYTTRSGVKIGLLYEPPLASSGGPDMERLQRAVLHKPKRRWRGRAKLVLRYLAIVVAVLTLSGLT